MDTPANDKITSAPVWDLSIRLFHWLLVASIVAALALGFFGRKNLLDYHLYAGYLAGGLIAFRLVWGVLGSTFARFSTFPPSLAGIRAHLGGRHPSGYGHNPLGALMVYALLAMVAALVVTGFVVLGGVERQGPVAALTSFALGRSFREIHETLALILVGLIALHIGGVMFESRRENENLARAMITGRKRIRTDATPTRPARPLPAALALTAIGATTAAGFAYLGALPNPAVPSVPALAEWKQECGACHSPHHPSLLPATTWDAVLASLDHHFGENASLDPATARKIGAWLEANSAEHFDTKASNFFRAASDAEPLRITATQRWKRLHEDLPEALFSRKSVGGRANCSACHQDAEAGLFAPQMIAIPD